MAEASVQFELGGLKFSAEGSEAWITKQLEFVISKLPELGELPEIAAAPAQPTSNASESKTPPKVSSLASYIKEKGGDGNQVQRYLVTADWLRLKGEKDLKTSLVTKALKQNHQSKLGNPAECLNKNVSKGFCEKTADGFFITPEGLKVLGHTE